MIVDFNAFIGKWPYWPVGPAAAAEVAEALAGWRIDRAAICSTRSVFVDWEDGNSEVERACRERPSSFMPFACLGTLDLSPARPSRDHGLERYAARGFRGIRLYPQHHSYHPLYEPFVDRILEEAGRLRWPVVLPLRLIMNWGMPVLDLGIVEGLVGRHSGVTWVLSGVNYLHELQLALSLMRRYPSVHLETSCVMGFDAIARLVEQCGADRILFGSAAPIQHAGAGVAKVLRARIAGADREAILGLNARRLLSLE